MFVMTMFSLILKCLPVGLGEGLLKFRLGRLTCFLGALAPAATRYVQIKKT